MTLWTEGLQIAAEAMNMKPALQNPPPRSARSFQPEQRIPIPADNNSSAHNCQPAGSLLSSNQ